MTTDKDRKAKPPVAKEDLPEVYSFALVRKDSQWAVAKLTSQGKEISNVEILDGPGPRHSMAIRLQAVVARYVYDLAARA